MLAPAVLDLPKTLSLSREALPKTPPCMVRNAKFRTIPRTFLMLIKSVQICERIPGIAQFPMTSFALQSSPTAHRSINTVLGEDCLTLIFDYFGPQDLLRGSECCTVWHTVSLKDKQLWEKHAIRLWDGRTYNRPDLSDINILERVKIISLKQLKSALVRVDTTRCVEKIDYQRMFLANLLFRRRCNKTSAVRTYYPEWALQISLFKATYFYSLYERNRTDVFKSELCAINWVFHFHNPRDEENIAEYRVRPYSNFFENYTLLASMRDTYMPWQFITDGYDNITRVQVDRYEPCTPVRMPNGTWRLVNEQFYYEQINDISGKELPLL